MAFRVRPGNSTICQLAGAALCVAALAAPAFAATGTGSAQARMRKPVTLANTRALDFGTVLRGATAGTVTINPRTGARTRTGGVVLVPSTFTSALFAGTGTAGAVVTISLSAPSTSIPRVGGGGAMTVNTFRVSANGGAVLTLPRNYTLPATGAMNFSLGGRLNVAANQADGNYLGSFSVTLNYQ